jgi:hypothetical protein
MDIQKGDQVRYVTGAIPFVVTGTVQEVADTGFGLRIAQILRDTTPDGTVIDSADADELWPTWLPISDADLVSAAREVPFR